MKEKGKYTASFSGGICCDGWLRRKAEKLLYEIPELKRVKGKKESYAFLIRENVLEEAENALVIYGSDRLGTIYGLFHLSELLGVTPMLYWGIVLTKKEIW